MATGGNIDVKRVAALKDQFHRASSATEEGRAARDQVLDELQDAVGLSGRMVTERDILRRADQLVQAR